MEIELERCCISGYEVVLERSVCQEETMESIVPDACPDILRIADVCGYPVIGQKQAADESAAVTGTVCTTVLYEPEEGGAGLRKMEVTVPFTIQLPVPGLTGTGKIFAVSRLQHAEARILNPRKILLRVNLTAEISVYRAHDWRPCCGVGETVPDLCQKRIQREHCFLRDVVEKPFVLEDRIRLKATQGQGVQVLSVRSSAPSPDCKLIGSKLILKGTAELVILTQDSSRTLSTVRESLPYSQIMEVNGGEESSCLLTTQLQASSWEPTDDGGDSISICLRFLAQARVYQRLQLTVLSDLYSTSHETDCQSEELQLCRDGETRVVPQPVRELIEADPPVHTILDSSVVFGPVSQSCSGEKIALSADAHIQIRYLDDRSSMFCCTSDVPVSCHIDGSQEDVLVCTCTNPDEIYAVPSAGGVEIRFNSEFICRAFHPYSVPIISSACLGEVRDHAGADRPSVVLRLVTSDDSLWELAKLYATTGEKILAANNLDSGLLPEGAMLLIPRTY